MRASTSVGDIRGAEAPAAIFEGVPGGNRRFSLHHRLVAEREGFSIDPFLQVVVIPTLSDSSLCLCGCRAHS
jgi:hypothetical protein